MYLCIRCVPTRVTGLGVALLLASSDSDGTGDDGAGVRMADEREVLSCASESKWNLQQAISGGARFGLGDQAKPAQWNSLDGLPEVRAAPPFLDHLQDLDHHACFGLGRKKDFLVIGYLPHIATPRPISSRSLARRCGSCPGSPDVHVLLRQVNGDCTPKKGATGRSHCCLRHAVCEVGV